MDLRFSMLPLLLDSHSTSKAILRSSNMMSLWAYTNTGSKPYYYTAWFWSLHHNNSYMFIIFFLFQSNKMATLQYRDQFSLLTRLLLASLWLTYWLFISNYKAHSAGKISIERVIIFLSKYISKDAVDMTFSPDVDNPSNPYIQIKQNKYVHKLSYV